MKFLLAFFALAWYVSSVQAEEILSKSCFNMVAVVQTAKVVKTSPTIPTAAQATYHWERVQVCNNGVCRIEWRAVQDMPATQKQFIPVTTR